MYAPIPKNATNPRSRTPTQPTATFRPSASSTKISGVDPDLHQVLGVDEEREDRERDDEREEIDDRRGAVDRVLHPPRKRARAALLGARDPLVDADPRLLWALLRTQTFFTSGLPKIPCGRTSMNTIRMRKTTRSLNALPSRPRVKSSM